MNDICFRLLQLFAENSGEYEFETGGDLIATEDNDIASVELEPELEEQENSSPACVTKLMLLSNKASENFCNAKINYK